MRKVVDMRVVPSGVCVEGERERKRLEKLKYVPVKRPTNYVREKNVLSKVVMSE